MSQSSGQINRQYRQAYPSPPSFQHHAYHGEQTWPSSADCHQKHPAHSDTSIAPYSPYGGLSNELIFHPQFETQESQYSHQAMSYLPQASSTALVPRSQQLQNCSGSSHIASPTAMANGEVRQSSHEVAQRIQPGGTRQHDGSTHHIPIGQPADLQMGILLNEMMADMQQIGGIMERQFANIYGKYRDALAALCYTRQENQQLASELQNIKNSLNEMRNLSEYWKKQWEDSNNKRMDTERQVAAALASFAQARADADAQMAEKHAWVARFAALLKYAKMQHDNARKCSDSQASTVEVEAEAATTDPAENETELSCPATTESDGHIAGDQSFCTPTVDTGEDSFDTCSPNLKQPVPQCVTSQGTTEYLDDGLQTTTEQDMIPVCDGEHYRLDDHEFDMELQYPSGECDESETLGPHDSSVYEEPDEPSERMTTPVAVDTYVKIEDPNPSECSLTEGQHGQRLSSEHINLLCHQTAKEYICRLCIIQFPDKAPMTFPLHSSHHCLIDHGEDEHPLQCDYIASLTQEQLIEAQNRLNGV